MFRKLFPQAEGLRLFREICGGPRNLLVRGLLNVILYLGERHGGSAQALDGRLVQKVVIAKYQKGRGQNICRQKQGNRPAMFGDGYSGAFMR